MQYGRVEVSADGGAHYVLIGRVLKPATATVSEKVAMTPSSVLRSRSDGIAFSVLPGQILKLRPQTVSMPPAAGRKHHPLPPAYLPSEPSAIVTTLEPGKGLFGALLPPFRCPVRLQNGADNLTPFADAYAPTEEDVFVFLVSLPDATGGVPAEAKAKETLLRHIEQMRQTYAATSTARARAAKRLVSGTLTLNAKLPANEPDPIAAVTFAIDGNVVAAENTPPFSHAWDTHQVPDGEHVVEIRALNGRGSLLTRVLALIVVQNTQPNPPTPFPGRSFLAREGGDIILYRYTQSVLPLSLQNRSAFILPCIGVAGETENQVFRHTISACVTPFPSPNTLFRSGGQGRGTGG
jgi:hypothetical protein